ncbi:MAG: hypothetical protein IJF77_00315 [Alistipes sp.]|nr:hypothetical protein [Alistipes sp.]
MTGLRKRVTVGFLSIVCLLFISGMLSFFELSHLSRDTGDILKASRRNIELAKEILDAAHNLNVALIHSSVLGERHYDTISRASMRRLEEVWLTAQSEALDKSFLDSLAFAATEMKVLVDNYLSFATTRQEQATLPITDSLMVADSLAVDSLAKAAAQLPVGDHWYTEEFEGSYNRLTAAVKAYMTSTQSSLAPRTEQLKKNAYRAVTPVLISLVVMIAIVLMFYYFMTIYCVNPILSMNKSLGAYLSFRVPFGVKAECKDEMLELKEKIETLIGQVARQRS